jgi:chromosome segregation ATPase
VQRIGNIADADLLKYESEINRLSQELDHLESSQNDEACRIINALQSIRGHIEKDKEENKKKIESLEQRIECHDREIKAISISHRVKISIYFLCFFSCICIIMYSFL